MVIRIRLDLLQSNLLILATVVVLEIVSNSQVKKKLKKIVEQLNADRNRTLL